MSTLDHTSVAFQPMSAAAIAFSADAFASLETFDSLIEHHLSV
jgi:hypothetical protein